MISSDPGRSIAVGPLEGGVRSARARSGSDHAKARVLSRANYRMVGRGLSRCFSLVKHTGPVVRGLTTTEQMHARAPTTTASSSPRRAQVVAATAGRYVACQPTAASPGAADLHGRQPRSSKEPLRVSRQNGAGAVKAHHWRRQYPCCPAEKVRDLTLANRAAGALTSLARALLRTTAAAESLYAGRSILFIVPAP